MVLTLSARSMTTPLASPTIRRHIFSTTSFTWCIYTYFCNICFYACFCPTTSVVFMPLPTTLCFLSVRPSVRCPSSKHLLHITQCLCTWWRNFNETCCKYSSCECALLKMFTRSEVKGQGHICTDVLML